jgi:tetratricopeptide (TPR) repeat protein
MATATAAENRGENDLEDCMEDFIIIWLDATINSDRDILFKRQCFLQTPANCIRTFVDQNKCVEYIQEIHNEQIFLIVSGSLGQIVVPLVHDLSQVSQIYVFCADKLVHKRWSESFKKIRGIFNDENPLMICLKSDIKIYTNALIPISISTTNERSFQDIDEEQVGFLWFQLLIEVIYRLPQTSISKEQMLDECRANYADNPSQLRLINEFYKQYNSNLAIKWYTRDAFLYRLLNKAFRTRNIDTIFDYHYFLTDLFKQLTLLHNNQFSKRTGTLTVYRGQGMYIQELEKLQNSIGRLMSINTFLSTTTACVVAADFAGNGEYQSQGIESVIFQIEIDLEVQRRPFGRIEQFSINRDENEILFAMGSVFRIEDIQLYTDHIWLIELTLTSSVKKEVEDLLQYFTLHIGTQPSILELGVLLSKIGDFERAKRFYRRLLAELPPDHIDLGPLYNNLGEIYRQQGYFDEAMNLYKKATDELIDSTGFLDEWFAVVRSNMAIIFDARGELEEALIYYRCALFILQHLDSDDAELFSTIYNGMAAVVQQQGKLMPALKLYEKALKIELQVLPPGHPSIATTYTNMGQLYKAMENISAALDHFLKALPILLAVFPNNHPQLAIVYESIGGMYAVQHQDSDALTYYLKAEETIDQSTLAPDHKLREEIYLCLALILSHMKMNDASIRRREKVVNVLKVRSTPDHYQIAFHTHNLGKLIFDTGDREQAFVYHKLALESIQQLPRTKQNKDLYSIIADAFQYVGHLDISLALFKLLLEQEEEEENDVQSVFIAQLHNKLGILYDRMKENQLAIEHYTSAWHCYMNWSDTRKKEIAITRYNIAVIQRDIGDYEQACLHLQDSLSIIAEDEHDIRSQICVALAETYAKSNDWARARQYFQHAIEQAKQASGSNHPMIAIYTSNLQELICKMDKDVSQNSEQ